MTDFIKIGFVGKAIGLKGYFRVNFITDCLENIKDLKNIFLQKTGKEMSSFEIEDVRIDKPDVIKLNGINNRNEVENIRGQYLYISKSGYNEKCRNLYIREELPGCKIFYNNEERGEVVHITNFGASDIVEVKATNGEIVNLPFINEVFLEINIPEKKIKVDYFDDYL